MNVYNRVMLIGTIKKIDDVRQSPKGTPVLNITLEVTEDKVGQKKISTTQYFDIVLWGRIADYAFHNIKGEEKILLDGRLWRNPEKGLQIVGENIVKF